MVPYTNFEIFKFSQQKISLFKVLLLLLLFKTIIIQPESIAHFVFL